MNRIRIAMVLVMSLIVGGLVLQSSGIAGPDKPKDTWGPPPNPPTAPLPPPPPTAGPMRRGAGGYSRGISISIRGNKIHIDGLEQLVAAHLAAAQQMLANSPNVPKDVRDKILARMDAVKAIVDKNLKNLSSTDIDKLDDQLEKMGDELEKAMEGLDADLGKLGDSIGKKVAKDLAKRFGKDFAKFGKKGFQFQWNGTDDDDQQAKHDDKDTKDADNTDDAADVDITDSDDGQGDDQDVTVAIDDLKNFALKPSQKDAIAKLRVTSDAQVAAARKQLDEASKKLETALADVKVTDDDVTRYVDRITAKEAEIRKARLLAWVAARRVLDADQVKKLEAAHKTR